MGIEAKHLRLVREIARTGSVTKASRALHLTQSAVSHQLLALERRVGTPVFARTGKRMVATQAGRRLLEVADRVLVELREAEEDLRRIARGDELVVRISTECYTCYHWLPEVMETYKVEHPEVDLQIVTEATRYPVQALLEGRIDYAIVSDCVDDDRVMVMDLFDDEMVLLVPPGHRLAGREWIEAEEFAEEHLLLYAMLESESTLYQRVLIPAGVEPKRLSTVQLTEAIVEMVKAAMGVAVLARWAVEEHLAAGTLVAVRVTRDGLPRQWGAAVLKQDPVPEHLLSLTRLLARPTICCTACVA
jgi:LysR family transcriptional regulator for metE and metH